jgi:hypothetical protein
VIFCVNYDGVLIRCLEHDDAETILKTLHDSLVGGNCLEETMAHKILRVGYYWPTFFRDGHAYARKCKSCQVCISREKRPSIPLHPVTVSIPFEQWGIDVIG